MSRKRKNMIGVKNKAGCEWMKDAKDKRAKTGDRTKKTNIILKQDWQDHDHDKKLWEMVCVKEFKNTEKELQKMMIEEAELINESKNIYNYTKSPPAPKFSKQDIERFWRKVDKSGDHDSCWEWTKGLDRDGYGNFFIKDTNHKNKSRTIRAHKVSYYLVKKKWIIGLQLCHICDNPKCVNPKHLKPRTSKYNTQDRTIKNKKRIL